MTDLAGTPPGPPGPPDEDCDCLLRLYVSGNTARSTRAIQNLRAVCERFMPARYQLEVIDIYQRPQAARDAQIIAVPTLLKLKPEPTRLLIGDLSDFDRLCNALDIAPERRQ